MKRILTGSAVAMLLITTAAGAQDAPFGTDTDAEYAAKLWTIMEELSLAGDGMIRAFPYEGVEPHGKMLETFYTSGSVDGHDGALIIKRNYGPEGVTADQVLSDPDKHLGAVTVMFRREEGYDPDNGNWFWAKYLPDGTLDKTPNGMRLAGRVAKGADAGCIACHSGAGDDYLFTTDHLPIK
ncbi:cytochrome P460 family protein [Pontibaca salina]|uniref:Cytochrome P460 family protein n=1 Tax=Pontibaca salina TaxID=2795731 RepID=A0A934M428_9RHOB|nr:cytochrome P460 family protein [Pontibaca salina]MBI6630464.1 cytochrome P460 family protein [Pontibaca salina]